mmetsp:Transcript_75046/g.216949  ORF Transcript_75046/g.216949 Transcript_75046/m.216949 type:complete len:129 (-) Transcript_75046:66-452(-)
MATAHVATDDAPLVHKSFAPPGRLPPGSGAVVAASGSTWPPETPVERLLDDVSDIWVPALVLAHRPDGGYDIRYCDERHTEEKNVQPFELRLRQAAGGENSDAAAAAHAGSGGGAAADHAVATADGAK